MRTAPPNLRAPCEQMCFLIEDPYEQQPPFFNRSYIDSWQTRELSRIEGLLSLVQLFILAIFVLVIQLFQLSVFIGLFGLFQLLIQLFQLLVFLRFFMFLISFLLAPFFSSFHFCFSSIFSFSDESLDLPSGALAVPGSSR